MMDRPERSFGFRDQSLPLAFCERLRPIGTPIISIEKVYISRIHGVYRQNQSVAVMALQSTSGLVWLEQMNVMVHRMVPR